MIFIEIGAALFTLICIYLTIKNDINCWWTGIVSNFLYFILFYDKHIYADMSLQLVFISQGAWAWWMWYKPKIETPITRLKLVEIKQYIGLSIFIWILSVPILQTLHGNNPPFDALVTSLSIMGIYLTGKRKLESWHFWILADIVAIILYFKTGLYLSSLIYTICLLMAFFGIKKWQEKCLSN